MAKLTLNPAPSFSAEVSIPLHGGGEAPVKMTFKHRTKTEMEDWRKSIGDKSDPVVILEMVTGWELDDELNLENVERLTENYAGSAMAILKKYVDEITQARLKN